MAILLPDARELSDEVLNALRLRAMRGCELGFTETDVADLLGVRRETVSRWWSAYIRQGGCEALPHDRSGRPAGTGRTLSGSQSRPGSSAASTPTVPKTPSISAPLWTRRAVQQLIHRECGIDVPVRHRGGVSRACWGYTAKRPRRASTTGRTPRRSASGSRRPIRPSKSGPLTEVDAEIHGATRAARARRTNIPPWGYAPEGEPAVMDVPGPHIRTNQISTVTNEGVVRFMTYDRTLTAALFVVFLGPVVAGHDREDLRDRRQQRVHMTPQVADRVTAHQDRIELYYLPRDAPELNATEYLNHDLKGQVNASGLPNTKEGLRWRMQRFMRKLQHLPEHVRNYFQHPYMLYAIGS